jgi:O-methyltransferase/aklanonic acid methyltransferase
VAVEPDSVLVVGGLAERRMEMMGNSAGGPAGAGVFERAAQTYERVGPGLFSHYGRRLVELAGLQPGGRVLDVAAGAGAVLLPAAERAGPHGEVVGVDLAAAMVARLRQELAARGVGNAAV